VLIAHPDFSARIEALVGELERATDAEIVVVAARRSGGYRDIPWLAGAMGALLALGVVLYSPLSFSEATTPVYLLATGALCAWFSARSDALLRRLTRAARRRRQVEQAARAAFVEEAVHGTRGRSGILVYVSEAERLAVLVRDLGLDGRVPRAAWNGLDLGVADLEDLLVLLRAVGAVLAAHLPATADNPNEIPDAPRVRS
jgi:putative membrane protein